MQKRRYMKYNFAIKPPERLSQPKKMKVYVNL